MSSPHLRHLNLSRNLLSEVDSNMLSALNELISVDLSYNKLTILSIEVTTNFVYIYALAKAITNFEFFFLAIISSQTCGIFKFRRK